MKLPESAAPRYGLLHCNMVSKVLNAFYSLHKHEKGTAAISGVNSGLITQLMNWIFIVGRCNTYFCHLYPFFVVTTFVINRCNITRS